jgi:hypothetical protein
VIGTIPAGFPGVKVGSLTFGWADNREQASNHSKAVNQLKADPADERHRVGFDFDFMMFFD